MAETDTNTGPFYCPTIEQEIDYRWSLGYAVGEDGTAWPMLIDHEYEGQRGIPTATGWRDVAPHEGIGHLPKAYVIRCEATTHAGRQCSHRPKAGTPYCGTHEDRDALMVAIRGADCVSALRQVLAENRPMSERPTYVEAYKARGKQLEAEGAIW